MTNFDSSEVNKHTLATSLHEIARILGEGKIVESGTLEIPGSKVSDVIQGIANATQGISDKLNEDGDSSGEDKKKSSKKDNKSKK